MSVPEPKSNTRDQVLTSPGFTQAAIVKSCRLLTIPLGSWTYWLVLRSSDSALPNRPGTRPTVTGCGWTGGGATLTDCTSYLAAVMLAWTVWSTESGGKPDVITPS